MKTPIYKLYSTNNNIYIKRDDLLPYCFGGNKYRISQCYIDDMLKNNANHIIAYGPPSSNLCRVLSCMAKSRGIKCTVICATNNETRTFYNSVMLKAMNAELLICSKNNVANTVQEVLDNSKNAGFIPYYIYGNKYGIGREHIPVKAYYDVYSEICMQEMEIGIHFDKIYIACGTGTSYSGLLCANINDNLSHEIIALSVARDYNNCVSHIKQYVETFLKSPCNESLIKVVDKYRLSYSEYNKDILHTIKHVFEQYGVPLDPIYTGKAFWAMEEELKHINNQNILFIHTGGTPLFFDYIHEIMEEA